MSAPVWTVFKKEALENLRDRRTLFTSLLFGPLFGPTLFVLLTTLMLDRAISDSDQPLPIVIAGEAIAPNLVGFLRENGAEVTFATLSLEEARARVSAGEHELVLLIPEDFPERWASGTAAAVDLVADSSRTQISARVERATRLITAYGRRLAAQRLLMRGINPALMTPVTVRSVDVATPASRAVLILGMTTFFILMSTLMGGLYLAIDTTAGERERASLEPLFTLPVQRSRLVLGKVLATCAFMTASLILTLLAFVVSLRFVPLESLGMSANFSASVALAMLIIVAPFVPFGAGLMTVIGALTKSYREAQTWISAVLMVPTLPIVFATITSLRPSLAALAVPSLGQHLLLTDALRGDAIGSVEFAVSASSTLLAAALLIALAVNLYAREGVLG